MLGATVMKVSLPAIALFYLASVSTSQANPELPRAVAQAFGDAVSTHLLLVKGSGTTGEPSEWTAYARDAFHPSEILRISIKADGTQWKATAAGAGENLLNRVPSRTLEFSRLSYRCADARAVAAKAAALAQSTFASVDYQLAANPTTGAPEWGLALKDDTGYEIGFCVVSAETGALTFQDWTPRYQSREAAAARSEGEKAAEAVKRAARKTWIWTDNARKETRGFFRELFR